MLAVGFRSSDNTAPTGKPAHREGENNGCQKTYRCREKGICKNLKHKSKSVGNSFAGISK